MVVVEEVVSVLPPQVSNNIGILVKMFQAVSVAIIVYVIYLVGMGVILFKRMKKMRHIEKKVDEIDRKLDLLLKEKKKKKR